MGTEMVARRGGNDWRRTDRRPVSRDRHPRNAGVGRRFRASFIWQFHQSVWRPAFGGAAVNTLIAGVCTTAFSLLLGFSLAFLVTRTDMPGRNWLGTANMVPFFLSPYVGAISW